MPESPPVITATWSSNRSWPTYDSSPWSGFSSISRVTESSSPGRGSSSPSVSGCACARVGSCRLWSSLLTSRPSSGAFGPRPCPHACHRCAHRGLDDDGPVQISRADFTDPRLSAFLQAHLDDMEPTAPPESRHALDLTALQGDGVRLWVGRAGGDEILGTVALAAVDDGHEELKSMRTEPRVRGTGVATRLLAHALHDARRRGVSRVSLETGSMEFFEPARRFYSRAGF